MNIYNQDCMEAMKEMTDNQFDLAIVDPPYGIGAAQGVGLHSRKKYEAKNKNWDNATPNEYYFKELFRVSQNQIICGAFILHQIFYLLGKKQSCT